MLKVAARKDSNAVAKRVDAVVRAEIRRAVADEVVGRKVLKAAEKKVRKVAASVANAVASNDD